MKMVNVKALIGTTVNYITLLEPAPPVYYKNNGKLLKRFMWKCRCVCGKEKILPHHSIQSGTLKSCGCKRKELISLGAKVWYNRTYKTPVEKRHFDSYQYGISGSKKDFHLTFDQFCKLVNSSCYYCGLPPFDIKTTRGKSRFKALNGLDRVDSSKDYSISNVVPCCKHCNRAKMARSLDEFLNWIKLAYNHLNP